MEYPISQILSTKTITQAAARKKRVYLGSAIQETQMRVTLKECPGKRKSQGLLKTKSQEAFLLKVAW